MARIFNIYFTYDGRTYSAVVSVRTTPFFTEYNLNNFSEELTELLPGNKIISRGAGHYVFQNAGNEHSPLLMEAIIRAVSEHLHTSEV